MLYEEGVSWWIRIGLYEIVGLVEWHIKIVIINNKYVIIISNWVLITWYRTQKETDFDFDVKLIVYKRHQTIGSLWTFVGFPELRSSATWVNLPPKQRGFWKRWRTANDFAGSIAWFGNFIWLWVVYIRSKQTYAVCIKLFAHERLLRVFLLPLTLRDQLRPWRMKRCFDLHIECNWDHWHVSGGHVVRRKTSKSARNSTVICLEAPTGFEGNVMTLLVKWSDLFISGQLFTVLFPVGQF